VSLPTWRSHAGSAPGVSSLVTRQAVSYPSLKVTDLKKLLKDRGLPVSGTKAALIGRLKSGDGDEEEEEEEEAVLAPMPTRKNGAVAQAPLENGVAAKKVDELRQILRDRGLPVSGTKAALIARLQEADADEEEDVEEEVATAPATALKNGVAARTAQGSKAPAKKKVSKSTDGQKTGARLQRRSGVRKPQAKKAAFAVGELAEASEDIIDWYEVKVLKDLGEGSWQVARLKTGVKQKCEPGYIRKKISEVDQDGPFMAGEHVRFFFERKETWFGATGVLQTEHADGSFTLIKDEDGEDFTCTPDKMIKLGPISKLSDLKAGMKVRGMVAKTDVSGVLVDIGVAKRGSLPDRNMKPAVRNRSDPKYDVGERVLAYYHDDKAWYPATVNRINTDGTFRVLWDDESEEPYDARVQDLKMQARRRSLRPGQVADLWIYSVNLADGKFSLTMYEEQSARGQGDSDWASAFAGVPDDEFFDARVERILRFNLIASLQAPDGTRHTGSVHISCISDRFVDNIYDEVEVGDSIRVRITRADADKRRQKWGNNGLQLSMRVPWGP